MALCSPCCSGCTDCRHEVLYVPDGAAFFASAFSENHSLERGDIQVTATVGRVIEGIRRAPAERLGVLWDHACLEDGSLGVLCDGSRAQNADRALKVDLRVSVVDAGDFAEGLGSAHITYRVDMKAFLLCQRAKLRKVHQKGNGKACHDQHHAHQAQHDLEV